jgi:hypothetical protein
MDTFTVWDFRGKQLLTFLQYKLQITEEYHFDRVGAASYHQVFALTDLKLQESATELSTAIWPGSVRAADHRILGSSNQTRENPSPNAICWYDMMLMLKFYHFSNNFHLHLVEKIWHKNYRFCWASPR